VRLFHPAALTALALVLGSPAVLAVAPAAQAAAPEPGTCWGYNVKQAEQRSSGGAVDCATNHSAETFYVGDLRGNFANPAKASPREIGREFARNCTMERMNTYLGVSQGLPLRTRIFMFLPSAEQWQAGERWVRCDVAMRSGLELQKWRGPLSELIASSPASTFQYCTPSVGFIEWPDPVRTRAQRCTTPKKQWILVGTPKLGEPAAKFPGQRNAERRARDRCAKFRDTYPGGKRKADRNWFYIYPTSVGWDRGERNASCWVPLQQYADTIRQQQTPAPESSESEI
jgi:hypothetical protein